MSHKPLTHKPLTCQPAQLNSTRLTASWQQACWQRLAHLWYIKSVATASFMAAFFYVYFAILNAPMYAVTTMGTTFVDDLVPFWPPAFYMYASLWVYTSLVPALQPSFLRIMLYGLGIGLVCSTGLLLFYFFPTAVPYASADWFNDPALVVLRKIDMTGNACPSLHVACAIFTAICLNQQLKSMQCPHWLKVSNWLWCVLIVYSTLAIKQHVMWDVIAGVLLGIVCALIFSEFEKRILLEKR
jgi:membrane-associated phospholipid phosphatase